MTRFALCWNREGGPVPPEVRRAVGDAVARRSAGAPLVLSGPDVVAWCAPSGWAGDAERAMPLELGGWIGTGALRLDDRESLVGRLRDRGAVGPVDDATLALQSFAAWGERAPGQWLGDYALAVLAADRGRLFLTRGTLGVLHCFHARAGQLTIVADDPAVVAEAPGVDASLDERAVIEYLATGELVTPGITFRRGVQRVPAAHSVVIHRDGRASTSRHRDLPDPPLRDEAEPGAVIEEFRSLVRTVVRDRLRAPKAALLLSGGVDSALLASSLGAAAGGSGIVALTASWERLLATDDEARWACATAAATGLPHQVLSLSAEEGIIAGASYETPEPAPDPEPLVSRMIAARVSALAPIALLGEDPDMILFPPTLIDQMRSFGVASTVRGWVRQIAAGGTRPWIGLRRSFRAVERWRTRRESRPPGWVRHDLIRKHRVRDARLGSEHPTRRLAARALESPTWENSLWNDAPQMSGSAVQVVLPFMDPRIIAFAWSLPPVPWAQRKHLLRETLRRQGSADVAARPKSPMRGYYEARTQAWRRVSPATDLHPSVASWVDLDQWRREFATGTSADRFFECLRVRELSRWLSQASGSAS